MIAHLSGIILSKTTETVVLDVGGVGYELSIPLSTYSALPAERERVDMLVHTTVRDDSIKLYGFLTPGEKELFRLFITVSGIGPKLARNILSGLPVEDLVAAIAGEDRKKLGSIPGIGRKATERIIIDLKDKVAALGAPAGAGPGPVAATSPLADEVISALQNLGYRPAEAAGAVELALEKLGDDPGAFERLLKEALREISRR